MKKMLALVLAVLMLLTLAACAKAPASSAPTASKTESQTESKEEKTYYNKTGMPICDDVITISCTGQESYGPWSESMGLAFLEETTGIQLDCQSYNRETWETQFTLMMSNNSLPDVIFAGFLDRANVNQWGEQGLFVNMLDYAELMPNMMAYRERETAAAAYETAPDGGVYGITAVRTTDRSCINDPTFINLKWLKAVNKEVPTTADELLDVLRAFKAQDANGNGDPNDEIPISFNDASGFRLNWILRAGFGIYSTNTVFLPQADSNGKIYLADTSDAYKDYLKLLRTMFAEELLDNTCFMQTEDEFMQKTKSDRVGLWTSWNGIKGSTGRTDAEIWTDYALYAGFTTEYTDEIIFPLYIKAAEGARTLINAKSKYVEAACRLIDWGLYSTEGSTQWNYGKEGVTFEWIDDGRGNQVENSDKFADLKTYTSVEMWRQTKVMLPLNAGGCVPSITDEIINKMTDAELQKMVDDNDPTYANSAWTELFVRNNRCEECFPFLVFTAEEKDARGTKQGDMAEYIKTMRVAFINGTKDIDAEWDSYCAQLKAMGADEVIAIYQAAYDRFKG